MEIDLVLPKRGKIGFQITSPYFGKIKGDEPKPHLTAGTRFALLHPNCRRENERWQLFVPAERWSKCLRLDA